MNIQLLPDLAAMALLLTLLYFLQRRHPQERVDLWLVGLLFIFLEAIAHAVYTPHGPWHRTSHIVALDAYLAAGVIFLWTAATPLFPRRPTLLYLIINTVPLCALLTTYGLDVRDPRPYYVIAISGLVLGVLSPLLVAGTLRPGRGWGLIPVQLCLWNTAWFYASHHMFRDAIYLPLFVLYLSVAVVFQFSLPSKSLGKVAIVLGFTIWALVFLLHSWVTDHPQYLSIAAEIWDMQKFLVTIGTLLIMLEHQVTTNEWFARHDYLTGLPNRRLFEERLARAVEHSQRTGTRTALFMIDLNGFKRVNDSFGHEAGDEMLRAVSSNLRNVIRTPDTLARFGGDEFLIITSGLPGDQPIGPIADRTLNRISQALHKPVIIAGNPLAITGSIGVAIYPDDTTDENLLRRIADQRMYQQKQQISLQC
jgi:diguanylate cyclase (GGDEF)-like protein